MKPINKAAEALVSDGGSTSPDLYEQEARMVARAVFASIDTDELAQTISNYLLNYTLPVNYGAPLSDEDHTDVAERCGPLIAEAVKAHLLKEDT